MQTLVIIGAGGFGREVKTIIDAINSEKKTYDLLGWIDDGIEPNTLIDDFPVMGNVDFLSNNHLADAAIIAMADYKSRITIIEKLKNTRLAFPKIIHPSVILGDFSRIKIGKGTIICAGCMLTTGITISEFCILNLAVTIGHDVTLGRNCAVMPSVNISGNVTLADNAYIGTGAKVLQNISIGQNAKVGAGAVVVKNVSEESTVVGVPAKPLLNK